MKSIILILLLIPTVVMADEGNFIVTKSPQWIYHTETLENNFTYKKMSEWMTIATSDEIVEIDCLRTKLDGEGRIYLCDEIGEIRRIKK